jgi:hypothetical protein
VGEGMARDLRVRPAPPAARAWTWTRRRGRSAARRAGRARGEPGSAAKGRSPRTPPCPRTRSPASAGRRCRGRRRRPRTDECSCGG